ncbi:MAG: carboxymuconolactone decarboxylase family protein [Geobacter sp.]|nr:carboxymuconolactone decarboxylase family protein [Geobacter sp.]
MATLNTREHELVALGAALASNCVPCIEFHIQEARKAGLTDAEIAAAIELADKIKRVPADKVLEAASRRLSKPMNDPVAAPAACCTPATDAKSCC